MQCHLLCCLAHFHAIGPVRGADQPSERPERRVYVRGSSAWD